jgi:SAM-dependent methyltransferase
MNDSLDPTQAYDAAFATGRADVVDAGGQTIPFEVHQWNGAPDVIDRSLFIEPCDGPTIDVGCGPGRLVGELAGRGIPSLGIDVSSEAVRQARGRGAYALRRDVFGHVPGEGEWEYALLADGNVGIGGDPVRLLSRVSEVLTQGGRTIVEVAGHGVGLIAEQRRLRINGRDSAEFAWAVVGLDAIAEVAAAAGMRVDQTRTVGPRHAVTLVRP